MVVQRTILPKQPNIFTLVPSTGSNLKTVINVPNSVPILTNPSSSNPGECPKKFVVCLIRYVFIARINVVGSLGPE